jgi:DNA repair protein RecO
MKQLITKGIVLSRTDFGEADRILTLLTPDQGKLRLMARGVRRAKSKLAGSIELFSTSDITFMRGRGEIGTLISARLIKHFGRIVKNIDRVQLGYELIKTLNRATEDQPEAEYYELLEQAFAALDDPKISIGLIRLWFELSIVRQAGHAPNLRTDTSGQKLEAGRTYNFDFEAMSFISHDSGNFKADDIKFLRLIFNGNKPKTLNQVQGIEDLLPKCELLGRTLLQAHVRT